jgi:hypothetical protein
MKSKTLALLGIGLLFAMASAWAQIASQTSPSTATEISIPQHPPMRLLAHPSNGTATSSNWSGYAVTGSDFTYADGSWHVPQVSCSKTPNTYSAFWVGIDGYSDSTVEQIGTASDCSGTAPKYYAWYEFYPAGPVLIDMNVSPGDVMNGSVTYSDGEFSVFLHDHTTGAEFKITKAVAGAHRTSAEFIAEAPCCTSGGGILPLADFVRANFGEDYDLPFPGTNFATDQSVNDGPISAFGADVEEITMETSGGVLEAVPTALTADGASFRVNWKSE